MNADPAETALIDPTLQSWVTSANDPTSDFPLQNLPFAASAAPHWSPGRSAWRLVTVC